MESAAPLLSPLFDSLIQRAVLLLEHQRLHELHSADLGVGIITVTITIVPAVVQLQDVAGLCDVRVK